MDILYKVLIVLHFIGLASLLGGVLVQMKALAKGKGSINPAMVHGALVQIVSGVLLVGIASMGDGEVNHMKIGIKALVLVLITVLVFVYRKKANVASWVVWLIGLLTLTNIAIAVFV